jgi:hypothetical protein
MLIRDFLGRVSGLAVPFLGAVLVYQLRPEQRCPFCGLSMMNDRGVMLPMRRAFLCCGYLGAPVRPVAPGDAVR